jgi:hypothetical protein
MLCLGITLRDLKAVEEKKGQQVFTVGPRAGFKGEAHGLRTDCLVWFSMSYRSVPTSTRWVFL